MRCVHRPAFGSPRMRSGFRSPRHWRRSLRRTERVAFLARRAFYDASGHYWRNRVFEAFRSQRYAWPALLDLDRRLAELAGPGPGTFVEAGAHDGFTQSNTYWLERHGGWSG